MKKIYLIVIAILIFTLTYFYLLFLKAENKELKEKAVIKATEHKADIIKKVADKEINATQYTELKRIPDEEDSNSSTFIINFNSL